MGDKLGGRGIRGGQYKRAFEVESAAAISDMFHDASLDEQTNNNQKPECVDSMTAGRQAAR